MVGLVVYYIRHPEWGRFLGVCMGCAVFEDFEIDLPPSSFCCSEKALEVLEGFDNPELLERCFIEQGVL